MDRLIAPAAGAAFGALAWLVLARPEANPKGLEVFDRPPPRERDRGGAGLILARLEPVQTFGVFPKTDLPPAESAADVGALKLLGTSSSPTRRAALVSVGGATPQWIAVGAPVSGLELIELHASEAVIRSASGQTTTLSLFPAVSSTNAASPSSGNGP